MKKYKIKSKRKQGKFIAKTSAYNSMFKDFGRHTKTYHKSYADACRAVEKEKKDVQNDIWIWDQFHSKIYKHRPFVKAKRKK